MLVLSQTICMARELDSLELQIQEKVASLLKGLQALAQVSNEQNIPALIQDIELLSLTLPGDSQFIGYTQHIQKIYDEAVSNMVLIHTNLQFITQSQESG